MYLFFIYVSFQSFLKIEVTKSEVAAVIIRFHFPIPKSFIKKF